MWFDKRRMISTIQTFDARRLGREGRNKAKNRLNSKNDNKLSMLLVGKSRHTPRDKNSKTTYLCHFIPGRPADLAEVLGDQQGGRGKLEFLLIDVVEALAALEASGDGVVDFFHGQAFEI